MELEGFNKLVENQIVCHGKPYKDLPVEIGDVLVFDQQKYIRMWKAIEPLTADAIIAERAIRAEKQFNSHYPNGLKVTEGFFQNNTAWERMFNDCLKIRAK